MSTEHGGGGVGGGFRRRFGRGLAILLPSILTLWLLFQIAGFLFSTVAQPINAGIRLLVIRVVPYVLPEDDLPGWFVVTREQVQEYAREIDRDPDRADIGVFEESTGLYVLSEVDRRRVVDRIRRINLSERWSRNPLYEAAGLVVAVLLIYFAGLLLGNFIGRKIYERLESLVSRVPGFKQIYPHVKQLVDLVLGEKKIAFQQVVLIEYPGPGIWSIGFLTGDAVRQIDGPAGGRVRTVFIPNSPTPFTGFTVSVREDRIVRMHMTVDEALRFVVTAGVLSPEGDRSAAASAASGASAEVIDRPGVGAPEAGAGRAEGSGLR